MVKKLFYILNNININIESNININYELKLQVHIDAIIENSRDLIRSIENYSFNYFPDFSILFSFSFNRGSHLAFLQPQPQPRLITHTLHSSFAQYDSITLPLHMPPFPNRSLFFLSELSNWLSLVYDPILFWFGVGILFIIPSLIIVFTILIFISKYLISQFTNGPHSYSYSPDSYIARASRPVVESNVERGYPVIQGSTNGDDPNDGDGDDNRGRKDPIDKLDLTEEELISLDKAKKLLNAIFWGYIIHAFITGEGYSSTGVERNRKLMRLLREGGIFQIYQIHDRKLYPNIADSPYTVRTMDDWANVYNRALEFIRALDPSFSPDRPLPKFNVYSTAIRTIGLELGMPQLFTPRKGDTQAVQGFLNAASEIREPLRSYNVVDQPTPDHGVSINEPEPGTAAYEDEYYNASPSAQDNLTLPEEDNATLPAHDNISDDDLSINEPDTASGNNNESSRSTKRKHGDLDSEIENGKLKKPKR